MVFENNHSVFAGLACATQTLPLHRSGRFFLDSGAPKITLSPALRPTPRRFVLLGRRQKQGIVVTTFLAARIGYQPWRRSKRQRQRLSRKPCRAAPRRKRSGSQRPRHLSDSPVAAYCVNYKGPTLRHRLSHRHGPETNQHCRPLSRAGQSRVSAIKARVAEESRVNRNKAPLPTKIKCPNGSFCSIIVPSWAIFKFGCSENRLSIGMIGVEPKRSEAARPSMTRPARRHDPARNTRP